MSNITKALILLIVVNLVIGIAYTSQSAADDELTFSNWIEDNVEYTDRNSSYQLPSGEEGEFFGGQGGITGYLTDFINVLKIGGQMMLFFFKGLNPFIKWDSDSTSVMEQFFYFFIGAIRLIIVLLLLMELFMLWRNRKVNT